MNKGQKKEIIVVNAQRVKKKTTTIAIKNVQRIEKKSKTIVENEQGTHKKNFLFREKEHQ